jgi:hypothetical protein
MSEPVDIGAISFDTRIEVIWEEGSLAFSWRGGEYVEVRLWSEDDRNQEPHEVINVFDYERGAPEISTRGQMEGVVAEWIIAQQTVALLGLE